MVDRLRADGELLVSLVAVADRAVIGHIAFSPVRIDSDPAGYSGLGPVSVHPDHQARGVGAALITAGLQAVCTAGARGCVVLGEPALYSRFGFEAGRLRFGPVDPAYMQHLTFGDYRAPYGEVAYPAAFLPES